VTRLHDGKELAKTWNQQTRAQAVQLSRPPGLAVVLVGHDPASQVYVRRKGEVAERLGFVHRQLDLPADSSLQHIVETVQSLNEDPAIDGILVQLPLPGGLDGRLVTEHILPEKDVDGLTTANVGALAQGKPVLVPCTPRGVLRILQSLQVALEGMEAVVLGRSNLFGRPMAMLLEQQNATVTVAHSRTRDLPSVVRRAELVVAAVGQAEMVRRDWVREGAIIIDVGINRLQDGRIVGDVAFDEVSPRARAITPVPGGVGPTTIAMLMENTLIASTRRQEREARPL
jgi:methylenetetrahydrofolate dehydrogenase (NADP+)/methenyltetrahydrofolate cyclohydrolase